MDGDPYVLLGVSRGATAAEIRRAYRGLAARFHPDRDPGADARDKFRRISEAYDVLSDSAKRAAFDMGGAPRSAARPTTVRTFQVHPKKRSGKVRMSEDFRRAMRPGAVYVVRADGVRTGPVPVIVPQDPAMPEVPLWTKGRRG
jgi:curved DNA-binding protein CbpA